MNTINKEDARAWMFGDAKEINKSKEYLFGEFMEKEQEEKRTYTDTQLMDKWRKERGTFTSEEFDLISEDVFGGEFLEYCHKWNVLAFQDLYHEIKKMFINKKKHELPDFSSIKAKTANLVRLFNNHPDRKEKCRINYENAMAKKAELEKAKHSAMIEDEMSSIAEFYENLIKSKTALPKIDENTFIEDEEGGDSDGDFSMNNTASSLIYRPQFPKAPSYR
jgi:hypothetical protein